MSGNREASLLGLLFLVALGPTCGGRGAGGGTPPPFLVLSTTPLSMAANVVRTGVISLVVNGVANPATLTSTNVFVTANSNSVPATASWNAPLNTIEIRTSSPMAAATLHTVSVTSGVTTTGGTPMTPMSFSFTTSAATDTTLPTFGGASAAAQNGTSSITLTWSAGADDTTSQPNLVYDVYLATSPGFEDFANPPATTSAAGATSVNVNGLSSNRTYFLVVRCRDQAGNEDTNTAEVSAQTVLSFDGDIWTPIVQKFCSACHSLGGAASFMDLSISAHDVVVNKWVNVLAAPGTGPSPAPSCGGAGWIRVVPNDPSTSLVYLKLSASSPCGNQMPDGGPYLSATQIKLFFDWISQGANDN